MEFKMPDPIDTNGYSKNLSLARQVQQRLLEYMVQSGFQGGERLPTEPELCRMFEVSRTSLREAIKYLEISGIVSVQQGRGTFFRSFAFGGLLRNLPIQFLFREQDFLEVVRVRQVLEEFCVEQAIVRIDDVGIEKLAVHVRAMNSCYLKGESMKAEDQAFHHQLASLADNRLLLMILDLFWELRNKLPQDNSSSALKTRYERHYRLYDAIRRRDLQLGRFFLAEHFYETFKELLPAADPP